MNYNNPKLREMLTAEYVLGTLHGPARRRFERLLVQDNALRGAVEQWQQRLAPLDYVVPAVQPSERVWHAIAQRIAPENSIAQRIAPAPAVEQPRTVERAPAPGLWESLAFWRGLGLAASALAAALLIYLGTAPQPEAKPIYVAVLVDAKAQPAVAVNYSTGGREIVVSIVAPQSLDAKQSLELWALPKGAAPRSLGLIPATGKVSIKLVTQAGLSLPEVPALAVSLEPKGGSPTGAPTGPVLYSGALVKM
jgi:anti-sigma-K factor RskA